MALSLEQIRRLEYVKVSHAPRSLIQTSWGSEHTKVHTIGYCTRFLATVHSLPFSSFLWKVPSGGILASIFYSLPRWPFAMPWCALLAIETSNHSLGDSHEKGRVATRLCFRSLKGTDRKEFDGWKPSLCSKQAERYKQSVSTFTQTQSLRWTAGVTI